jgi:hypothetical protein
MGGEVGLPFPMPLFLRPSSSLTFFLAAWLRGQRVRRRPAEQGRVCRLVPPGMKDGAFSAAPCSARDAPYRILLRANGDRTFRGPGTGN